MPMITDDMSTEMKDRITRAVREGIDGSPGDVMSYLDYDNPLWERVMSHARHAVEHATGTPDFVIRPDRAPDRSMTAAEALEAQKRDQLFRLIEAQRNTNGHAADALAYAFQGMVETGPRGGVEYRRPVRLTSEKINDSQFWDLPVVAYLIGKIPAVRTVLEHYGLARMWQAAVYLLEAEQRGLSIKRQCEDLGVPWSARWLSPSECCIDAVKVAAFLPPQVFKETKPAEYDYYRDLGVKQWAELVLWLYERGAKASVVNWYARHCLKINRDDRDYLLTLHKIDHRTKPETIMSRSAKWHKEIAAAREAEQLGWKPGQTVKIPHDIESYEYRGLTFVALRTIEDFIEDGREQRHCIADRFSYAVKMRACYFSIRDKDGKRLSTVEFEPQRGMKFVVSENLAFGNKKPPRHVKQNAMSFAHHILTRGPNLIRAYDPGEEPPAQIDDKLSRLADWFRRPFVGH